MKILIAHNRYKLYGGEDAVFDSEVGLLRSAGHAVETLIVSNATIRSPVDKINAMLGATHNPTGIAAMAKNIAHFQPDLVHVHNFFPLLSPAIFELCHATGTPVILTLHNYRAICANGLLFRNNKICHLCLNHSTYWGAFHRCYQHSLPGSIATTRMISVHRRRGTWTKKIDRYIALSDFSRRIFVQAGFPNDRISIKPNCIADPGYDLSDECRMGVLYAGRLSKEKGVQVLLEASERFGFPVRIAGEGPEANTLRGRAPPGTIFLGRISRDEIFQEMKRAAVVVVPSLWPENCPLVVLEAFACATPVIGFRHGALAEMVQDGSTGLTVEMEGSETLGERIMSILSDPHLGRKLGLNARQTFVEKYTPKQNLKCLENIYEETLLDVHKKNIDSMP